MGILKQFFNNTRKPNGWMGKLMVNGMNQGMPLFPIGASLFLDVPGAAHSMLADFGCGGGRNTAELLKTVSGGKSDSPGLFQGRLRQNKAIQSE